jgi:membrane associated rhomboid family serine protease
MASRSTIRTHRISFDFYITPGVQLLIIANVAVFILEAFIKYFGGAGGYTWLLKWFGLVPAGVIPLLRIWQPFTYLFLHDITDIWHIVLNMFTLWMFGREVELVWGRNRFLRYYFLTGVGAGLLNVVVKTVPMLWGHENSYIPTIGASGAIFGILIACAILFPDRRAYIIPIPIPIKMKWIVAGMAVITFLGTLGLGGDKVSHICHLGGMLIGYLYLRRDSYLFRLRNEVSDWKYQRNRKKFDVYINKHKGEPPSRPDRWVN